MNQYFKALLAEQTEMALATSVKDIPNVRIVNFYYDEEMKKLFFISFKIVIKSKSWQSIIV